MVEIRQIKTNIYIIIFSFLLFSCIGKKKNVEKYERSEVLFNKLELLDESLKSSKYSTIIKATNLVCNNYSNTDTLYIFMTNISKPSSYDREYDKFIVYKGGYSNKFQIFHPLFDENDDIHYEVYLKLENLDSFKLLTKEKSSYFKWDEIIGVPIDFKPYCY